MGWVIFAALMMMVIGVVNVLQGIIALVSPGRTVVAQDRLYVVNLNGWGLTLLIFGAVLVCVGLGLMTAKSWARWSAMATCAAIAVRIFSCTDEKAPARVLSALSTPTMVSCTLIGTARRLRIALPVYPLMGT